MLTLASRTGWTRAELLALSYAQLARSYSFIVH